MGEIQRTYASGGYEKRKLTLFVVAQLTVHDASPIIVALLHTADIMVMRITF